MNESCKACGAEIIKTHINKHTGKPEDLCSNCLSQALLAAYDMEDNGEDAEDIIGFLNGDIWDEYS